MNKTTEPTGELCPQRMTMDYQDQTIMSGEGRVGDCFRACVATIMGRTTDGVPHFGLLGNAHAMITAIAWLNYHDYELADCADAFDDCGGKPEPLFIIRGTSPRGIPHAVVGDTATGKMVHDPHPSRAGVVAGNERGLYFFKRHNVELRGRAL